MLTHAITVTPPTKSSRKSDYKKARRLAQDLKCKKFAVGDTISAVEGKQEVYGQILDIERDIDMVQEWDGNAPLNVLVYLFDDQSDYLFNIQSLRVIQ